MTLQWGSSKTWQSVRLHAWDCPTATQQGHLHRSAVDSRHSLKLSGCWHEKTEGYQSLERAPPTRICASCGTPFQVPFTHMLPRCRPQPPQVPNPTLPCLSRIAFLATMRGSASSCKDTAFSRHSALFTLPGSPPELHYWAPLVMNFSTESVVALP